jgi:hypothetical protein
MGCVNRVEGGVRARVVAGEQVVKIRHALRANRWATISL